MFPNFANFQAFLLEKFFDMGVLLGKLFPGFQMLEFELVAQIFGPGLELIYLMISLRRRLRHSSLPKIIIDSFIGGVNREPAMATLKSIKKSPTLKLLSLDTFSKDAFCSK